MKNQDERSVGIVFETHWGVQGNAVSIWSRQPLTLGSNPGFRPVKAGENGLQMTIAEPDCGLERLNGQSIYALRIWFKGLQD